MKKITFIVISFLIGLNINQAQTFYTQNFNINDGLPSNNINTLHKDSRGFLWIGTNSGLAKFDGTNFKVYSSQNGINGNNITDICQGKNGVLWIATLNNGLSRLNGDSISNFDVNSGIVNNNVVKLHYSENLQTLFIGTENGLSTYNDSIGFKSFHNKYNHHNNRLQVTDFKEIDGDILIFTNGSGTFKYLKELKDIAKLPFESNIFNQTINSIFIGKNKKDTLICYHRVNLEIISKKKNLLIERFGPIADYSQDSDSNIWIAAAHKDFWNKGGLYHFNKNGLVDFTNKLNLPTDDITSLEYDPKENILWIGTGNYGIFLYPLTNFSYYNKNFFGLNQLDITNLHINKNNLYITTSNAIIIKNDKTFKTIGFNKLHNIYKEFAKNTLPKKYNYLNNIHGSFSYYQEKINNGTYKFSNPYVQIIDNTQKLITAGELYKPFKYDIIRDKSFTKITGVFSDSKGNNWIGSNVGIFKIRGNNIDFYDLEGSLFSNFTFDNNDNLYASNWDELFVYTKLDNKTPYSVLNTIDNNSPSNILKSDRKNDSLWFLTKDHGAYIYVNGKFFNTFKHPALKNITFNDICFDNYNNFVLGGNNGTIYIGKFIDSEFKLDYTINTDNGLHGTAIRWLKCSENNLLIVGTNAGLNIIDLQVLYNKETLKIKNFNKFYGFIDYAGKTCVLDSNNTLWLGSNKHLIQVDLNKLNTTKQVNTNFYINKIEVNGERYNLKSLKNRDIWTNIPNSVIELPYYKKSITFYFDIIEFLNPKQVDFSYKLEGFSKTWSKKSNERKIVFQNLDPGTYRLRIKAFYHNNSNSNKELSISFKIAKPIWKEWYMITFGVILALLSIWFFISLRLRSVKKKAKIHTEISERIMEFEMKALRAQMNPHFIFNAINSIQNFMLDNDIDEALNYLSDFAKLIRLTLDNVSKKKINLEDELEYLKYYLKLEKMRFDKKFEIDIITPKELKYSKIQIPPMLIQPFIENSIKHGFAYKKDDARINIQFKIQNDNILICSIEDNGIGRAKSKELNKNNKTHQSKGIFITNERLELLNQTQQRKGYKIETIDLYDDFDLASGTRVNIYIPI